MALKAFRVRVSEDIYHELIEAAKQRKITKTVLARLALNIFSPQMQKPQQLLSCKLSGFRSFIFYSAS